MTYSTSIEDLNTELVVFRMFNNEKLIVDSDFINGLTLKVLNF